MLVAFYLFYFVQDNDVTFTAIYFLLPDIFINFLRPILRCICNWLFGCLCSTLK
jgi:hypothetical protein